MNAAILYEGSSLLTGDPIVAIATNLRGGYRSLNAKTGAMAQVWILNADQTPNEAVVAGTDEAICGDCKLRGDHGHARACYVTWWQAPNNVYRSYRAGHYPKPALEELPRVLRGESLRIGAYGDPAAVPVEVWLSALPVLKGWTGYTHQWTRCDLRYQSFLMASVDNEVEQYLADRAGWRTFRARPSSDPLLEGEITCPASDEAGHLATCQQCQLCRGSNRPAANISIIAHGQRAKWIELKWRHA